MPRPTEDQKSNAICRLQAGETTAADERNSRHVYLLRKNINKPLVHFISHCRPEILQQM